MQTRGAAAVCPDDPLVPILKAPTHAQPISPTAVKYEYCTANCPKSATRHAGGMSVIPRSVVAASIATGQSLGTEICLWNRCISRLT